MAREMKDSGIAWIGEIPKEWKIKSEHYVFENLDYLREPISAEKRSKRNPLYDYYGASGIIDQIDYFNVDDKVLLIGEDGANLKMRNLPLIYKASGKFWVNNHAHILKPLCDDYDYMAYMLESLDYTNFITGSAQPKLSQDNLSKVAVCVPPIVEQQSIANFLDKKCSEIDELISLQEKMIDELKAYKQSVITETVTKGLNPNVEMKDSGVDWIGEIPRHWKVIRIKYLLNERKERSEYGDEEPLSMSQKYGLIPAKNMDSIPNMASSFVGAKLAYKEDLVFNKLKAHLGVFSVSKYDGLVSPDYAVYYSRGNVNVKYLEYLFKTPTYISEFKKLSSGVGAGLTRLYTNDLYSIYGIYPPIGEQQKITEYIDTKCSEIDSLISIKQQKINQLKDYKKSLIYEYVTGKKQVI